MRVHPHIPIGEIAASMPRTTRLFDLLGIDYVQHGNLSLRDACAEAGADPASVKQAIEAMPSPADEPNWADAPMQELLDELRDRRHPSLRARLAQVAFDVASLPSGATAERVRETFSELAATLQPHMTREEHMLFPVIQHLEDCWTKNEPLSMELVGGVGKPVATLVMDHSVALEKLDRLVAAGESTPLGQALEDLAHELREHIHLENNVLFPRACAIESAVHNGQRVT